MLSMLLTTTEYAPASDRSALERLLIAVAAGEQEALAELYRRTRAAVYGMALSYLHNAHDAQDLTQDVFVRVWDCGAQYRPTGSPMGWLLDEYHVRYENRAKHFGRQVKLTYMVIDNAEYEVIE